MTNTALWNNVIGGDIEGTTELLGEVVAWTMHGATTLSSVIAALDVADLPKEAAPKRSYRDAFARVCLKLEDSRIIRKVAEVGGVIHFQLTQEEKTVAESGDAAKRFAYNFETILSIDKVDGKITCEKPELAEQARTLLEKSMEERTANDVTNIVHKLFKIREKEALDGNLWPIRDEGAVYFAMASQSEFLSKIEIFVENLGGTMSRLPIPMGTKSGNKTVQEVVSRGLGGLIREMEVHVAEFGDKTRQGTMSRAAAAIQRTQSKIDAYSDYLGEAQEKLKTQLADVRTKLKAKIMMMADDDETPETETSHEATPEVTAVA